jgi:NAD(P)-dependent dehydrogenase (short-subunit alcohol dehydrogenase family)
LRWPGLGALERIDVLVNNAGLMSGQRRVAADGFDEVSAVNHLAPFLLTSLLLGKLTAAFAPGDHGDFRCARRCPSRS